MASIYEELDLDQAEVNKEAGSQKLGGVLPDPGVHDVTIKQIYIRKTDSGAKMLSMDLDFGDKGGNQFWETCLYAGDAKNNKATFAVTTVMPHIFQACGDLNPNAKMGDIKHKGETIQAMGLPSLSGKKMKIGFKHEENEYNGSINMKPMITAFLKPDGTNADGENLAEKLAENIAKNPVKKLKNAPAAATAAGTGDAAASAAKGW